MKKIFLGVSSLFMISENSFSKNLKGGENNISQGLLNLNSNVILKNNKSQMTNENILKGKKFLDLFKKNFSQSNLLNYSLTSMTIIQKKGHDYLEYFLENSFQKLILTFPIQIQKGEILEIYPSFYEAKSKKMLDYTTEYVNKDILKNRFESIFLNNGFIKLSENTLDKTKYWILIESENKVAYSFIRSLYNKSGLKPEYANKNINVVIIPSNYFDTNYSLEISALFKHYESGQDFIKYLNNKSDFIKKIEDKYFKKFKDGYASDFVIDMYKELNDGTKLLTEKTISDILKKENQDTDFVSMLKKEETYIETILKNNAFFGDYEIYKSYQDSNKVKYIKSIDN